MNKGVLPLEEWVIFSVYGVAGSISRPADSGVSQSSWIRPGFSSYKKQFGKSIVLIAVEHFRNRNVLTVLSPIIYLYVIKIFIKSILLKKFAQDSFLCVEGLGLSVFYVPTSKNQSQVYSTATNFTKLVLSSLFRVRSPI